MLVCLKESEHKYIKNLEKEYSIIHDLDHPCIIKGSKIFNKDQYDYIEMEFIDGKDLFDFIYNEDHLLDEQTIIYIFVQLAGAVKYCHKNNILHRDLKLENIMIMSDEKYKIKVIDFGISKIFKKEIFSTKKQIGTPGCMAPEIILRLLYSFPADIWALGCILYQMVAHREPFAGDNVDKVLVKTVQEEPPPILEGNFSEELKKLIFSMLVKNPQLRISLDEIFQLPIIQNTISEYPKLKEYIQN
jgi:serine/threonine protein kinase